VRTLLWASRGIASGILGVVEARGGVGSVRRALVPTGGGPYAPLALQLAWDIVRARGGSLTALRVLPEPDDVCEVEMDVLRQLVEDELGEIPKAITFRMTCSDSVVDGILDEVSQAEGQDGYDLIAIGASEEWFLRNLLFGSVTDQIADRAPCSVLMVRKYEPPPVSWVRRLVKRVVRA
jgi:nucleotide-binding universal stress UspA family protein